MITFAVSHSQFFEYVYSNFQVFDTANFRVTFSVNFWYFTESVKK